MAQTLDQWIREAIADDTKDGKCTSLACVHMRGDSRGGQVEKEVHSCRLGDKQWDPKALADMFRGKAESYAEELPGVQNFQLLAFYDNRRESGAAKPFRANGYLDVGGLGTESPTGQGLTQQAMRHMEVLMQTVTRQTANLFETSNRTIELLSQTNHQLRVENRDSFEVIKEMLMAQANNRHLHKMEELQYARDSAERKDLIRAAPALINSLTGKEVFPQATADTALVEMLIDSLANGGEETISKLAGLNLPAKVIGALGARFSEGMRQRQLAEHAHRANGMDPEDDVVGGTQ